MENRLRILVVVDIAWDERFGAAQVFIELANAWRAAGHTVSKYCFTDAYPTEATTKLQALWRRVRFPAKVARFIRSAGSDFDVIDALLGTVPMPKRRLRFRGLLVGRSVGLHRLYASFDRMARDRWRELTRGRLPGRLVHPLVYRHMLRLGDRALARCDLVNLPNDVELQHLRQDLRSNKPAVVQPYGLSDERRRQLADAAAPLATRLAQKKISFIGMWSARKGAKDWRTIIQRVRDEVPDARFVFLGTLVQDRQIRDELGLDGVDFVEFAAQYHPSELPQLLTDSTVGAFPSYAEGFGIAVLEQLAAGLPVVAYDAPGPRSILDAGLAEMLVPIGDVTEFSSALVRVLQADLSTYTRLCEQSRQIANRFSWANIADATALAYRSQLETIAPRSRQ